MNEEETAAWKCYATVLRKASRRLTSLYDEALAPADLRSTQYAILSQLAGGGPSTINELARVLVMDRSSLGHSLRPLQRDGLVSLDKGDTDRRNVYVTLTEAGQQRYEKARELWRGAQDRVAAVLGASAADGLRAELNELAADERLTTLA